MRKNLKAKIMESLSSVLPITVIVLIMSFTLAPQMPIGTLMMFLLGAVLLILGMGLFSLGADMSMMPMGDGIGGEVVRMSGKKWRIVLICFLISSSTFSQTILSGSISSLPSEKNAPTCKGATHILYYYNNTFSFCLEKQAHFFLAARKYSK